jgi:hypothetical protein
MEDAKTENSGVFDDDIFDFFCFVTYRLLFL